LGFYQLVINLSKLQESKYQFGFHAVYTRAFKEPYNHQYPHMKFFDHLRDWQIQNQRVYNYHYYL